MYAIRSYYAQLAGGEFGDDAVAQLLALDDLLAESGGEVEADTFERNNFV